MGCVQRMLEGKIIAITRDEESARHFVSLVESSRGKAIALPTISLVPKDASAMIEFLELLKSKKHDYTLFMSANAVKMIFDVFHKTNRVEDFLSALNNTIVVAVGPHTKEALENYNVIVTMMPKKYSSFGLIDLFTRGDSVRKKIIIPRSSASNNVLADSLSNIGMIVDEIHVYDVKPAEHSKWSNFMKMLISRELDCLVFTSASSVNSFFEVAIGYEKYQHLIEKLNSIKVIAIGPFTNDALQEHQVRAVVADEHTTSGTFEVALKLLDKEE